MKLIKQTTLYFRDGSSDKVYEVDLCEVGDNRYVVNFRYGRRGAALKEGAKTVSPVAKAQAERVFDDLVDSKVKKGYQPSTVAPGDAGKAAAPPKPTVINMPAGTDPRIPAILRRLANPRSAKKKKEWKLERVIWRAGKLKIREAAPLLVNLIGSNTGKTGVLRDYSIAWALGWCGDENTISALGRLYGDSATPDSVRRIAGEALLRLSDEQTRAEFHQDMIERLPSVLRDLAKKGPAEDFTDLFNSYLSTTNSKRFELIEIVYLIDNEHVRPALLQTLRTAPLRPGYFQRFRHIFKMAEYRRDAEIFGILAYRFEKEKEVYKNASYGAYVSYTDEEGHSSYIDKNEVTKPEPVIAYGTRTRNYFRHRVARILRDLGQIEDADYIKMAVGVLLPFTDADAQPVRQSSQYHSQTRSYRPIYWDAYAPYQAFNLLLYRYSSRYENRHGWSAWRCKPNYKPGDPAPKTREEAFPNLWDSNGRGLLHLLSESRCRPVHEFAVKALRANRSFLMDLPDEIVLMLLESSYEVTGELGFELALSRYNASQPNLELMIALVNCNFERARQQLRQWIEAQKERFIQENELIFALATSQFTDMRSFTRTLLRASMLPEVKSKALIGRLISYLMTLKVEEGAKAADISAILLDGFANQLRSLGLQVIMDLLDSPLEAVQELGGKILLAHEVKAADLPGELIVRFLNSEHEAIRALGIRLMATFSDEQLLLKEDLLVQLANHKLADIRSSSRQVIARLAQLDINFSRRFATQIINQLLLPETTEGLHSDLVKLASESLNLEWMSHTDKHTLELLLLGKSAAGQELAGNIIIHNVKQSVSWAEIFDITELFDLSNNEVLVVREAAQVLFISLISRCKQAFNAHHHLAEMAKAIRLLDVKWDDARAFWIKTFQKEFGADDFTPTILVSICDSTRDDIQRLGRELITKFFTHESGQDYMIKLSEHPSTDLQLFVTNYLETYAVDNADRLRALTGYFTSVLSRVNRSRVAKNRVLAFLRAEALKHEESARVVAEILTRQSVTIAIGDKASAIETMLEIKQQYPFIPVPLHIKSPEVRRGI